VMVVITMADSCRLEKARARDRLDFVFEQSRNICSKTLKYYKVIRYKGKDQVN
jgi:hypothetical protein